MILTTSQFLALFACSIGSGMGAAVGFQPILGFRHLGWKPDLEHAQPWMADSSMRGLGVMMLAGHALCGACLGFFPHLANGLLLAIAVMWLGSAAGRLVSGLLSLRRGQADRFSPMVVDALMAMALSAPLWAQGALSRGLLT